MKHSFTIAVTLLAALSLSACSSDSSKSSSKGSSSSTSKIAKKTISLANYEAIKLGDNGMTLKSAKSSFGKPDVETETEVPGAKKKATQYSWNNVSSSLKGASVNVQFIDGLAVGKGYIDASNTGKVSNSKYDGIQTGASFNSVKKQLGNPAGESVSEVSGSNAQVLMYTSGSKSISFTFMNEKLVTKSKTDLGQSN